MTYEAPLDREICLMGFLYITARYIEVLFEASKYDVLWDRKVDYCIICKRVLI